MFHLMVVEDDLTTRKLMELVLKNGGYQVICAQNGAHALELMDTQHVDLILLDVMMPEMDGYEFTRILRESNYQLPILMITAKGQSADKRDGFLAGTDDYMVKPVNEEEMLLRIKALLRRYKITHERKLKVGSTLLDYDTLTVTINNHAQMLPQKEFYLLYLLLSYPEKIFTRIQLMDEIWGMDTETSDNTINVHINRLRRRFETCTDFDLVSIRGIGYKAVKYEED